MLILREWKEWWLVSDIKQMVEFYYFVFGYYWVVNNLFCLVMFGGNLFEFVWFSVIELVQDGMVVIFMMIIFVVVMEYVWQILKSWCGVVCMMLIKCLYQQWNVIGDMVLLKDWMFYVNDILVDVSNVIVIVGKINLLMLVNFIIYIMKDYFGLIIV